MLLVLAIGPVACDGTHVAADAGADGDADGALDGDAEGDVDEPCVPGCDGGSCVLGEWATICAGTYIMGSPPDEPGRSPDEEQHEVTLTHDFELLSTEVTQLQFEEIMGYNPSNFQSRTESLNPVEQVTWQTAVAYCNQLSERAGLDPCYSCNESGDQCWLSDPYPSPYECPGYRLPTEAEWEYAARAGTTGIRYGDIDEIAWHIDNSGWRSHQVGQKQPNAWGLYDMHGNVREWFNDWFGYYPIGAVTDPWGPETSWGRVARGGAWRSGEDDLRAAGNRGGGTPGLYTDDIGFRPSRTLGL
jgi:formylglycine-generating enzyme required for sulfatase activity